MKKNVIYLIIGLVVTILILLAIVIFRKGPSPVNKFDPKPYQKTIDSLNKANEDLDFKYRLLEAEYNDLEARKQHIKTIYHEKIKYINGLSSEQLDSLIFSKLD